MALVDAGGLIECPMDPQINAALSVLFRRRAKTRERARRQQRPNIAGAVGRDAVEFVGRNRERHVVGAVKPRQRRKQCAAEGGVIVAVPARLLTRRYVRVHVDPSPVMVGLAMSAVESDNAEKVTVCPSAISVAGNS